MKKYFIIILSLAAIVIAFLIMSVKYNMAMPGEVVPAAFILLCVMLFKNFEIKQQ